MDIRKIYKKSMTSKDPFFIFVLPAIEFSKILEIDDSFKSDWLSTVH